MATRVVGITSRARAVPAATTSAYASGQSIGAVNTLENVANRQQGTLTLQSITLVDRTTQAGAIDLVFFRSAPTATDKVAFAPTDLQLEDYLGRVSITAGDYINTSAQRLADKLNIGMAMDLGVLPQPASMFGSPLELKQTSLFVVFVSRGIQNYGASAATALRLECTFFVD